LSGTTKESTVQSRTGDELGGGKRGEFVDAKNRVSEETSFRKIRREVK